MREFNILTTGDKIRNIRMKYCIKQEEITGGYITRNLISILENNKTKLTVPVAKILTSNINRICNERGIDFSVTEEYLLEDLNSQVKKVYEDYINFISSLKPTELNIIDEKIIEIDYFNEKYNPKEYKPFIYLAIANKYLWSKKYMKAYQYYLKAYENTTLDMKISLEILLYLGSVTMVLSKYDEALEFYKLAKYICASDDNESRYIIYYNSAVCFNRLNKSEKALKLFNKINDELSKDIVNNCQYRYVSIKELLGETLKGLKQFNQSLKAHEQALKSAEILSDEYKLYILSNIGEVYLAVNDLKKLKESCNKISYILDNTKDELKNYGGKIYVFLGQAFKKLRNFTLAKKYLIRILELYELKSLYGIYSDLIMQAFTDLLDIYIEEEDKEEIIILRSKFFQMISNDRIDNYLPVVYKFIEYYNLKEDPSEVEYIIRFTLKG